MKYLLILLFFCTSFYNPALGGSHNISVNPTTPSKSEIPVKPAKKKKKLTKTANRIERYLMIAAIYMSAAVGVIFISLIFQPIFIFAIIFLPVFLWSMSSIMAFMAMMMMFAKMHENSAEENQSLAANIFTLMLIRVLLLALLFFLADPIIAIGFSILFFPGFILQLIVIVRLLRFHKSKAYEKDMFLNR
jgi:hypothetical protein